MKLSKHFFSLAFVLAFSSSAFSSSAFSQSTTGKLYLMRSTGYTGTIVNYSFYVDGQLLCKLKNKSYSIHDLSPGEHTVSVVSGGLSNGKKSTPLRFTVEENKINYIDVASTQAGYSNKITCQEITKNSADPILAKAKLKTDCLPDKEH